MGMTNKLQFFKIVTLCSIGFFMHPSISLAQSEDDILNSIGSELEDESAKQKAQEKLEKDYKAAKAKADAAYKSKAYDKAMPYYEKMLSLKPDSEYAQNRINQIGEAKKAAAQAEIEKKYNAFITEADKLLVAEKFSEARAKYQSASGVMPNEAYPKTQIAKANELEVKAKEAQAAAQAQKKYTAAIAKADAARDAQNWEVATAQYKIAAQALPKETYPPQQIARVATLKKEAEEDAKRAAADKKYNALMEMGNKALGEQSWEVATEKYTLALEVKPGDPEATKQLANVGNAKSKFEQEQAEKAMNKKFNDFVSEGDKHFKTKDYDAAILAYESAKNVKPSDSGIANKIHDAKEAKKMAALAAENERIEREYKADISAADEAYNSGKLQESIPLYRNALAVKNEDAYAQAQIEKANAKISEIKAAEEKAALEQKEFDKLKKEGEEAVAAKDYTKAVLAFKGAQSVKPEDTEIKKLVSKAEGLKRESEELALKEKAQAEAATKLNNQFNEAMAQGAAALANRNYDEAITHYKKAKKLKPEEGSPDEAMAQVNTLKQEEADALAAEQARLAEEQRLAEEAKIAEEQRIAEEKRLAEEARQAEEAAAKAAAEAEKKAADVALAAEAARLAEEKRLAEEAQQKAEAEAKALAEAQEAEIKRQQELADLEAQKKAELEQAALQAKTNQFNELLTAANNHIQANDLAMAGIAIQGAKELFPNDKKVDKLQEQLTQLQTAEAAAKEKDRLLAEQQALADKEYQTKIAAADQFFASSNWDAAIAKYKEAQIINKNEEYPSVKIKEAQDKKLAADQEKLAKQKELEEKYSEALAKAESFVGNEEWIEAIEAFKEANEILPNKKGPQERIEQLNRIIEKEKDLAEQAKAMEQDFNDKMALGNQMLASNNFADAKRAFIAAVKLKPNDIEAQNKLKETESLWVAHEEAKKEAERQKMLADLEENYSRTVNKADAAFSNKNWQVAIENYNTALTLKADETHPAEQLKLAKEYYAADLALAEEERLAEEARALEKQKEQDRLAKEQAKLAALENEFDNLVNEGNQFVSNAQYKPAMANYKKALELKPDNQLVAQKYADAKQLFEKEESVRLANEEEQRKLAKIELEKRKEEERKKREEYLAELKKYTPKEIANRYDEGITEEVERTKTSTITKSFIVEKGDGRFLVKFEYEWGETFYYLNGKKVRADSYNWDIRNYKF